MHFLPQEESKIVVRHSPVRPSPTVFLGRDYYGHGFSEEMID